MFFGLQLSFHRSRSLPAEKLSLSESLSARRNKASVPVRLCVTQEKDHIQTVIVIKSTYCRSVWNYLTSTQQTLLRQSTFYWLFQDEPHTAGLSAWICFTVLKLNKVTRWLKSSQLTQWLQRHLGVFVYFYASNLQTVSFSFWTPRLHPVGRHVSSQYFSNFWHIWTVPPSLLVPHPVLTKNPNPDLLHFMYTYIRLDKIRSVNRCVRRGQEEAKHANSKTKSIDNDVDNMFLFLKKKKKR